ncbi:MAG: hypothetical protein AB7I38_10245 [Dehalococcoidia bacterium]
MEYTTLISGEWIPVPIDGKEAYTEGVRWEGDEWLETKQACDAEFQADFPRRYISANGQTITTNVLPLEIAGLAPHICIYQGEFRKIPGMSGFSAKLAVADRVTVDAQHVLQSVVVRQDPPLNAALLAAAAVVFGALSVSALTEVVKARWLALSNERD